MAVITCDPQHSEFRNNATLQQFPAECAAIFAEQSGHLQSVEMWKRSCSNYSGVVSAPHPAGHSDTVQPLVDGGMKM